MSGLFPPGVMAPALSRGTVDRATQRRSDPDWLRRRLLDLDGVRVLLLDPASAAPVTAGPALEFLPGSRLRGVDPERVLFLGEDDEAAYLSVDVADLPFPAPFERWAGLREVGAQLPDRDAGLLTHAVALRRWHETHTHCPRCGSPTLVEAGGHVRRCPVDDSSHFPRTDPAVIMLVQSPDGSSAVLGRQSVWPPHRFSCLAGFVEPGESAEQAVERETREEVGLSVSAVTYRSSQPWPFPASLMLGYWAVAEVGPLSLEDDELEAARWFTRPEVHSGIADGSLILPPPASIAWRLITDWLGEDLPGGAW